jgi:hypothetical protein
MFMVMFMTIVRRVFGFGFGVVVGVTSMLGVVRRFVVLGHKQGCFIMRYVRN